MMLYKLLVNFPDNFENNLAEAMSVQRNLMTYGYMLDTEGFKQLRSTTLANIVDFQNEVGTALKTYFGGTSDFKSLYDNFPKDILSMTDSELWYSQISHYWGKKSFPKKGGIKDKAFESVTYKVIKGTDENGILEIYKLLAGSGQALTPMDTKVLKYFATSGIVLPVVSVPFKENLAVLAKELPGFKVSTVIDVLRIAHAMSGGDPSLPALPKKLKKPGKKATEVLEEREKHKFKLNKDQKLRVLDLFESSNLSTSDLNTGAKYGKFIKLANNIRTQDHKDSHPNTFKAFNHLRNQQRKGKPEGLPKIRTWNSQVQSAFSQDFTAGVKKLGERPGEFLRKLDYLIRTNLTKKTKQNLVDILSKLSEVAEGSSNKVIFEVITHFEKRINPVTGRSIFIKGARNKTSLPDLPALPSEVVDSLIDQLWSILKFKMSTLEPLGKVYLDPELKKIPLPTNMRSLSESLIPIIRGQRLPIDNPDDKKVLRAFVHWNDLQGNQDLDLHGYLVGTKGSVQFGYNGSRSSNYGAYSGDVMNKKGPCAEYIDINLDAVRKDGFKYFLTVVNDFRGIGLNKYVECVTGFMPRDKPESNRTWLPETISTAMVLQSPSRMTLLGCYDLESMEYIHLDLDWSTASQKLSSGDSKALMSYILDYTEPPKVSVYDLLRMHIEARGSIASEESADSYLLFSDFKSDYTAILPWMGV